MTTVVWANGFLATDRQATWGGLPLLQQKLVRLDSGILLAVAGVVSLSNALIAWYKDGEKAEKFPVPTEKDTTAHLIVVENKECVYWYDGSPFPMGVLEPFMAWGSGREVAMGAMHALIHDSNYRQDRVARRAVEIAIRWDSNSGLGVDDCEARDAPAEE